MIHWIQDPKAVDDKTAMPKLGVSDQRCDGHRRISLRNSLNSNRWRNNDNSSDARRVIAAAEKKAEEIGQPMNIAVVDAGGNLVAHVRMDVFRVKSPGLTLVGGKSVMTGGVDSR